MRMTAIPVKPERALALDIGGRVIWLVREDWQALQRALANLGTVHQLKADLGAMLNAPITECSHCGGALETHLRIDLDNVTLKSVSQCFPCDPKYVIDGFKPAGSANDPETGIVIEEAAVKCVDCGEEVEGVDLSQLIDGEWWHFG